jgi:DNA polymerase-3 subunit beta
MKLLAQRDGLLAAFQLASAALPSNAVKPILKNFKATAAEPGSLTLCATDTEKGIRLAVQGMQVQEAGEAILPAQRMFAILRESREQDLSIEATASGVSVTGTSMEFELPGEDPALFPDVPTFAEEKYHVVASDVLRQMIRRTAFAAAVGETARFAMTGVLFELDGDVVRLVATDGRRLAKCEGKGLPRGGHETSKTSPPLVPVKALHLLEKNLGGDGGGEVRVCFRANEVLFATDTATVYSRLVDGRFPDYRQVFPKKQGTRIVLDPGAFEAAVRQAAVMVDEESKRLTFRFTPGLLTLTAQGAMTGKSKVEHRIDYEGAAVDVNLNPTYVVELLKTLGDGEELTLGLVDGATPLLFRSGGAYSHLVMPLA